MTKSDALVNALSVYSWAVFFGHGRLHELTNWRDEISLDVHFAYGEFDREREDSVYRSVVVSDADIEWEDRPDLLIDVLRIKWRYSE